MSLANESSGSAADDRSASSAKTRSSLASQRSDATNDSKSRRRAARGGSPSRQAASRTRPRPISRTLFPKCPQELRFPAATGSAHHESGTSHRPGLSPRPNQSLELGITSNDRYSSPSRLPRRGASRRHAGAKTLQVPLQRPGIGVPISRIVSEKIADHVGERLADPRADQMVDAARARPLVGHLALQRLEEHAPECVQVGPPIDTAGVAELLRGRVVAGPRAVDHPLHRRGKAEVDKAYAAVARQDDVARLDVTVDEADVVHRPEQSSQGGSQRRAAPLRSTSLAGAARRESHPR